MYNGFRSYGLSELWVVGIMGRRNRDLTPIKLIQSNPNIVKT